MVLSYPRTDIFTVGRFNTNKFTLMSRSEFSRQSNGVTRSKNFGSAIWIGEWGSVERNFDNTIDLEAVLNSLEDGVRGFYAGDLRRQYPKAYPTGVFNDTGVINSLNADTKRISLSGLPASFVITRGDYLCWNYNSNTMRALHQVMESVTANGSGLTSEFEVRPFIRPGSTTGTAVTFKKPTGVFKMFPGQIDQLQQSVMTGSVSFKAYESLYIA